MDNDLQIYEGLAAHLDRLPAGFPRTPTGVEMRILKRLFTPEEARLAQFLSLRPESAESIAARSGEDTELVAERLYEMSRKGLILRLRKGSQIYYMAAQFVIGIWEYHVNDLDPELIRDMNEYVPYYFDQDYNLKTPQLRTIPIPKSLTVDQAVMPYEQARQLILEQDRIAVAPCICRKEHQIIGNACDRPIETCLVFGPGAQYYEENGVGRPIDQAEAMRILEDAEKFGMVLQPSNAQKVSNICVCCGCCCQILKNTKRFPEPAKYVASNYYAVVDSARCVGCQTCIERCQMDAIRIEGETAAILRSHCIGCGLCVPTCPEEAVSLHEKPEAERYTPPSSYLDTYKRIAAERMGRGIKK